MTSQLSLLVRLYCPHMAILGFLSLLTACAGIGQEQTFASIAGEASPVSNSETTTASDDPPPSSQTSLSDSSAAIFRIEEKAKAAKSVAPAKSGEFTEEKITDKLVLRSDHESADEDSIFSNHVLISDHLLSDNSSAENAISDNTIAGDKLVNDRVVDDSAAGTLAENSITSEDTETFHLVNKAANEENFVKKDKPSDLWQRLRQGFQLSHHNHPRVRPHLDWYVRHQDYLDRVVERARPFLYEIVQEIARNDIPMEIALLPVVESAFQPFAYSPGRAAGIWQFIPGTGRRYGLKQNWWYDGRRDVPAATRAAIKYLKVLEKHFDGDWLLALAAYNSGEGRVMNAVRKNQAKGKPIDFWSLDLPNETRGYVPKLLAISAIVENTEKYGIILASIPNEPYLQHVDIGSQIDLALAAELAGLPTETLYRLNPAFNRWATDPKGPHILSLPKEKAKAFRVSLASVDKRMQWQRHRIKQGETLGTIAEKYQTTVRLLQQVNSIRDKWIRAGSNIIIPVSTRNLKHYLSADQRKLAIQHTPRNGSKTQYTVRKGDTLWDLSQKYNTTVRELASWNAMAPRDALMPGQRLVIWIEKISPVARRFTTHPSKQTQQRLQYKVRKGDSLARIAKKFRVSINNLRNWNSLPKNKYLQPGQRLTLYIDVTRQS